MQGHAGTLNAFHLGHEVLAVLAQRGIFRRDVQRVQQFCSSASRVLMIRLRQLLTDFATVSNEL